MWALVLAAGLGLAAGVLSGIFGVGGGILFVPTLTLVLGLTQLHAEASSLLAIVPVALDGTWRSDRYGNICSQDALVISLLSKESAIILLPLFLLVDPPRWKRLFPHALLAALAVASIAQSHANSFRFSDGNFSQLEFVPVP